MIQIALLVKNLKGLKSIMSLSTVASSKEATELIYQKTETAKNQDLLKDAK